MTWTPPRWARGADIVLGLLSILTTIIVVLNPSYAPTTISLLLALAILFNSIRIVLSGGLSQLPSLLGYFSAGLGLLAAAVVIFAILSPQVGVATLAIIFAGGLAIQGLGRLAHTMHKGHPRWLRMSAFTAGGVAISTALVMTAFPAISLVTLVGLCAVALFVNGTESIVAGIRPSTGKQQTLVKLVLFAIFYGSVNVNWIDLYYNNVPGYHIWLILTYMAPFGVLLVFQGLKDWQLAVSLGLLVSLVNDVGYFFSGDLFFGFRVQLVPFLSGQLGFEGSRVLFYFNGGVFSIPVTSYLMGATIYGRIAVVALVLYHWWKRPAGLPG